MFQTSQLNHDHTLRSYNDLFYWDNWVHYYDFNTKDLLLCQQVFIFSPV